MKKTEFTFNQDGYFQDVPDMGLGGEDFFSEKPKEIALKDVPKELSEEIMSYKAKIKEFEATNDHETYLVVVFSCKEDKYRFLTEVDMAHEHTLIDGYELANILNVEPKRPMMKLPEPLTSRRKGKK